MNELQTEMLRALEAQHNAIDALMAKLITLTLNTDKPFFPSESGSIWDACVQGNEVIKKAKSAPMSARPIREFPATDTRVESGPIQFGADWPGTFIRGDHAAGYALHLDEVLNAGFPINAFSFAVLKGLLSELQGSNLITRNDKAPREETP